MKRNRILLAFFLVFVLLLSACSSSVSASGSSSSAVMPEAAPAASYSTAKYGSVYSGSSKINLDESTGTSSGSRVYADADSKLIRQASVSIQTIDFPAAIAALDALTTSMGGYYESAQTQGGGYYDANAQRYATYTVRVPKDNCDAFLDATGDIGHVVSSSESSTDVGDQYYDTELRLKTLQTKQERLLALMEKADLMEDIIALENSLSDVQYEIEQLTSTLKRYDGLVDFASITVQVNEVIKLSDAPGEADSLGERLAAAFTNGFSDFGTALGNFTVWIAYHFIGTIIFAAVVAVAVIAGRRFYRRQGNRNDPPAK
jgi:hypothetical protein